MLIIESNVNTTDIYWTLIVIPSILLEFDLNLKRSYSTEVIFCITHFLQLSNNHKFLVSQVVLHFDLMII